MDIEETELEKFERLDSELLEEIKDQNNEGKIITGVNQNDNKN